MAPKCLEPASFKSKDGPWKWCRLHAAPDDTEVHTQATGPATEVDAVVVSAPANISRAPLWEVPSPAIEPIAEVRARYEAAKLAFFGPDHPACRKTPLVEEPKPDPNDMASLKRALQAEKLKIEQLKAWEAFSKAYAAQEVAVSSQQRAAYAALRDRILTEAKLTSFL